MAIIGMVMMIATIVLALFLVERGSQQNHEDRRKELRNVHRWLR
jgi:hypothetical protein